PRRLRRARREPPVARLVDAEEGGEGAVPRGQGLAAPRHPGPRRLPRLRARLVRVAARRRRLREAHHRPVGDPGALVRGRDAREPPRGPGARRPPRAKAPPDAGLREPARPRALRAARAPLEEAARPGT